jgi:DNA-binding NtrC family response regulator
MHRAGDVLVVDGDDTVRTMVVEALDMEGYAVRAAPDTATALAALRERLPELILIDVPIPEDIEPTISRIKEDHPDLPIALMTTDRAAGQSWKRQGFVACLFKPFEIDALLDCVRQYVLPRDQWPEAD